jgi:ABC-2 type transport system permease protein
MTSMATIRLLAVRELRERLRSRLVLLGTAAMVVLVVGLIALPALLSGSSAPTTTTIALVGPSAQAIAPVLRQVARASDEPVHITSLTSDASARAALASGRVDVALSLGPHGALATIEGSSQVTGSTSLEGSVATLLETAIDVDHEDSVLGAAGVTPETIRAALATPPLSVRALQQPPADQAARSIAALAAGVLLYMMLAFYGASIAAGVAQEKTSRMAEILLPAMRPVDLLIGKVAGIGLFGMAQVSIAVGAGLVANALLHEASIPSAVWALLPMVLAWFILGYALYAFAAATAGALVGRAEEVQAASAPILVPLIAGWLLTYATIADPGSRILQLLSFLPPLAPVLMPARFALGAVPLWQMAVAAALTLASVYGMARLAARIYAPALIGGSRRLSFRSALRSARPTAP